MYKVEKETTLLEFLLQASGRKRATLKNNLKYKQVCVNKEIETYFNYALHPGDVVEIVEGKRHHLPFDLLYEDDDLIVINKPSGLLSERTRNQKDQTAFALMKEYCKRKKERAYLVHRLDQETSGVMMFVKKERLYEELTHHWNDYVKARHYIAVVEGKMNGKGHIENYLDENKGQTVYITKKGGKKAITNYRVLKSNTRYSLVSVEILTGRKNQIRVHMASLHHPISGDRKYGGHPNSIHRLALHQDVFAFEHPFTHQVMRFEAKMPTDFNKLVK